MSAHPIATAAETTGKKRKRTGKEREERKNAAIQAQLEAEAAAAKQTSEDIDGAGSDAKSDAVAPTTTAEEDQGEKQKLGVDLGKAVKRVPQALKSLHPVFKQARTFETRRLIKKIKFLRTKPDTKVEIADLEGQLNLIHHTQLHTLAQSHLLTKLRKHPLVKNSAVSDTLFNQLTPSEPLIPTTSTSATPVLVAKVENRLCSSKVVADDVKGVISWILGEEGSKLVLGAKAPKVKTEKKVTMNPARAARIAAGCESESEDDEEEDDEDDLVPRFVAEGSSDAKIGSDDEGVQQDYAADVAGWESGSISGGDDGSESDGESVSDAISLPPLPPSKRVKASSSNPAHLKAESEAEQLSQSTKKSDKNTKASSKKMDITSSTFLPSLAAGFTRGDEGDSDPDMDHDPDGVIGTKKAERKNRRGQRARQAIWEKKYGKGAKHVVRARQEEEAQREKASKVRQDREFAKKLGRDAGWGAKGNSASTPATAASSTHPASSRPRNASFTAPISAAAPTSATPPADPSKKLHPSWEAARLRKQKMGAIPAVQSTKANKIVFD